MFCCDFGALDDYKCAIGTEEDKRKLVEGQEEMSTEVNSLSDQTKV